LPCSNQSRSPKCYPQLNLSIGDHRYQKTFSELFPSNPYPPNISFQDLYTKFRPAHLAMSEIHRLSDFVGGRFTSAKLEVRRGGDGGKGVVISQSLVHDEWVDEGADDEQGEEEKTTRYKDHHVTG
jgi:hypothetical protein